MILPITGPTNDLAALTQATEAWYQAEGLPDRTFACECGEIVTLSPHANGLTHAAAHPPSETCRRYFLLIPPETDANVAGGVSPAYAVRINPAAPPAGDPTTPEMGRLERLRAINAALDAYQLTIPWPVFRRMCGLPDPQTEALLAELATLEAAIRAAHGREELIRLQAKLDTLGRHVAAHLHISQKGLVSDTEDDSPYDG